MDTGLQLIVCKGSMIFDNVIVTPYSVVEYEQYREEAASELVTNHFSFTEKNKKAAVPLNKKGYNAYLISAYVVTLKRSNTYRRSALKVLIQFLSQKLPKRTCAQVVLIKLCTPRKQFLDYQWNEKIMQMVLERREADHAMSWLSTLGGAFSALGEEFQHCAEIAGKISVKQFELALRLGNPLLVARCKLYAALSLIQRGHFQIPKRIVKSTYKFAVSQNDIRLQNMCQGVWAKLKYCYKLQKQRKLSA